MSQQIYHSSLYRKRCMFCSVHPLLRRRFSFGTNENSTPEETRIGRGMRTITCSGFPGSSIRHGTCCINFTWKHFCPPPHVPLRLRTQDSSMFYYQMWQKIKLFCTSILSPVRHHLKFRGYNMILRATILLLWCAILVTTQGDSSSTQTRQNSLANGIPGAPNSKAAQVAQKSAAAAVAKADVAVKQVRHVLGMFK